MTCRHNNLRSLRVHAYRLILNRLDDTNNDDMIALEIADCPGCWQRIAVYLASLTSEDLVEACGGDEAAAIAEIEARITLED